MAFYPWFVERKVLLRCSWVRSQMSKHICSARKSWGPSFLWTRVPCCCLSRSRFLGPIRSLLSPEGSEKVLGCVWHSWVEIGFFCLCPVLRALSSWSWQAKRKADFVIPARLCYLNTECGWTEDPRTLQVCTYHNVCRPDVDWIVFRISIDEIKVSTQ